MGGSLSAELTFQSETTLWKIANLIKCIVGNYSYHDLLIKICIPPTWVSFK